jgi:S-adenosylmethionine/arginine decarboxylase-like enzyme
MLECPKAIATRWQHLPPAPDARGPVSATFNHQLLEFTSIDPARLRDTHALSGLVVAAAGAVGMPSLGPPVVREGAGGIAVALLCLEGHIVLHCAPEEGACLVEIIARAPADVSKGIDVISRRLGS